MEKRSACTKEELEEFAQIVNSSLVRGAFGAGADFSLNLLYSWVDQWCGERFTPDVVDHLMSYARVMSFAFNFRQELLGKEPLLKEAD